MALHAARRQGRGGYAMLSEPHRQQILQDHALELDLPHAVAAEQFVLHYQPIVATATGEVLGHEALVRWQHPERGLLAPGAFLPAVQAGGLMVELGAWVLRTAVRAAARGFGGAAGRDDAAVSVNVSAQQLVRGDLVATVREAPAETGLPPARLLLELTESELLPGTVDVAGVLAELRGLGVRLAVDDFGTGWSNLAHLARLPLDVVTVDRSFLLALPDEHRRDVLAATVAMTSALGARCLIEGVETPEHLALARAVGSDYAQGYLLGRPVPLPDEA
ncbi:EAL domain-containing protein [Cellulomonas marina]